MLHFDEETHTYVLDNRILKSVSAIVASQFRKFNPQAVSSALARTKSTDEESPYFGMTQAEILQQWNETGKESRDLGVKIHREIEEFYKHGIEPIEKSKEWNHFTEFREVNPDWICVATEYRVHNDKVAGTIDAIFRTPEGIVLVDWKRCKSIDFSGYGNGKGMMRHVADCNYSKYSLQLSLYRELLGDVAACYIIQLHPSLETYSKIKAQNFHVEAKRLLA
jgi:ATP-dependent exoDNAse (exonuclease V) beta subunit